MPVELSERKRKFLEEGLRRGVFDEKKAAWATEALRRAGGTSAQPSTPSEAQDDQPWYVDAAQAADDMVRLTASGMTLGLADRVAGSLGGEGYEAERSKNAAARERAGGAGLVAEVGGGFGGGALAARGAARLGLKPAKTFIRRLGQYAGAGAAGGAAEQVIREGEVGGDTVASAALGATVGTGVGGVAEKALPGAINLARRAISRTPKISRAWKKLAKKLQTPVDDMAQFIDDYKSATGQAPSVAQAVHARDQGLLQGWAARHNTLGTEFDAAARETRGLDLNPGKLKKQLDDRMDAAMSPIRETPVSIDEDLLGSPHIADAMAGPKMKDIRIKVGEGTPLTVGDVDRIRQKLRGMQQAEPGGPFQDFADQLRDDTAAQVPEYGEALERYAEDFKFLEGFKEGNVGKALSEVEDKVKTPRGRAGHEAGRLTEQGRRSLRTVAPSVPAEDAGVDVKGLSRGIAHSVAGSQGLGIAHLMYAIRESFRKLPARHEKELARGLLSRDPVEIERVLDNIRTMTGDLEGAQRLAARLSLITGAGTSSAAGGE